MLDIKHNPIRDYHHPGRPGVDGRDQSDDPRDHSGGQTHFISAKIAS